MQIDYTGKTIVVTGAGGGIGRASTLLFSSLGGSVVATDIDGETLQATADACSSGGAVTTHVADVTNPDEAAGIVQLARKEFGSLDVLFNNAGGSFPTPMQEIDRAEYDRIRSLNFDAVYHACMEAIPIMVEQGKGAIVSTTSGAGSGAVHGLAVYGAAKAGVNSLMRSIALEYGSQGIRANAIAPSAATPGMIDWLKTRPGGVEAFAATQPMGRIGTADDIAPVAAFPRLRLCGLRQRRRHSGRWRDRGDARRPRLIRVTSRIVPPRRRSVRVRAHPRASPIHRSDRVAVRIRIARPRQNGRTFPRASPISALARLVFETYTREPRGVSEDALANFFEETRP